MPSMSRRIIEKLTPTQCDLIVKRGVYRTVQGRTISGITTPGYTTAQFNIRGWDGIKNGDASCVGVKSFKEDTGEEVDRTVESLFMEFTIRRVKIKVDRKSKAIAVAGTGEKLACDLGNVDIPGAPSASGCAGVGETYVWKRIPKQYCPLHYVQSAKGMMVGRTFVSPHLMIAFTVDGKRANADTCRGAWQATDVNNVFASADPEAGRRLPTVSGTELDPFLAVLLLQRFLAVTQVHLPDPARTDEKLRCLERLSAKADMAPFKVGHDHFATITGDAVHVIQCKRLKVKLRATPKCYRDIPITHDRWRFLDIENRVAKPMSSERPCRQHFPIMVEGMYHWWTTDGGIQHADPPKSWTGSHIAAALPSKPDGFYTQAEVDEWEAVQAMPVYFQQLEGSIRLKSCSASLGCPQPAEDGGYDWEKLERELPLGSTMLAVQTAWEWVGEIDQGLVIVFVPLMIYLLVKVKRLENAMNRQAASVNVAVTAPTVAPAPAANGYPGMRMEPLNPYRGVYA